MSEAAKIGTYVMYGKTGVCFVKEQTTMYGSTGLYYVLNPISDSRSSVFVPSPHTSSSSSTYALLPYTLENL